VLADVGVGVAASTIDEEPESRVVAAIQARDFDHGARTTCATSGNLDLGAGEVELGVCALRAVDGNVLNANKILARRRVAGQDKADLGLVPAAPIAILQRVLRAADDILVHLEPITITLVVADVAGSLRHVDGHGAGMQDLAIVPQLEADALAGVNGPDLCARSVGKGARVAAEVSARIEEVLGRLNVIVVLTDVLPVIGPLAVDSKDAVYVVTLDRRDGAEEGHRESGEADHLG
jgi:hypothetical protein